MNERYTHVTVKDGKVIKVAQEQVVPILGGVLYRDGVRIAIVDSITIETPLELPNEKDYNQGVQRQTRIQRRT